MPKKTFYNISVDKQNMIIESGKSLFSNNYYEHVDVKMIVGACKIPRGSFYAYFTNIEDYYFTVIKSLQLLRVNRMITLSNESKNNFFDFLIEIFISDMQDTFFSEQKLLIQHYFRYIQTQHLGFHNDENNQLQKPIFDVLNKYNIEFGYDKKTWNNFLEFCMSIYLSTYIKAIHEKFEMDKAIQLFKNRINIIRRGVL